MDINFDNISVFTEGMSYDLENKAEKQTTFQYGENARLYSDNGILSLSSIKGTKKLFELPGVLKYLGGYAFKDQLVLFAKYDNDYAVGIENGSHYERSIVHQSVSYPNTPTVTPPLGLTIADGLLEELVLDSQITEQSGNSVIDDSNESCTSPVSAFNLQDYFQLSNIQIPSYEACIIEQADTIPENNGDIDSSISDIIIVLTKESDGSISNEIVWNGFLDWDINRKITAVGIDENSHYKRVYFTDSLNPFRTFNLRDKNLAYKSAGSFNIVQDISLLQPHVGAIESNGNLKAMSVQYFYRLITENGQVSSFSPLSKISRIFRENTSSEFEGGDTEEYTNKSVTVICPVPDYLKYKQIECIALEYLTFSAPTGIKLLGVKNVSEMVAFTHSGDESDYSNTLSLAQILTNANTWKYCNAVDIQNNKLIAGGLRNQPYPVGIKYLEDQFLLRGWDQAGLTHSCLINPEPSRYKYIDPANTEKYFSVVKTQYTNFLILGNFSLKLVNHNTGDFIKKSFSNATDKYFDYTNLVYEWLITQDLSLFPNLKVSKSSNTLLLEPIDPLVITDLGMYRFKSSTEQSIINFENEYSINSSSVNTSNLIFGATSHGFNTGTGIRLSWTTESDLLMTRKDERYTSGPIFPLETPSLKRGWMKDEIYRIAITFFKNGAPLFAIALGDIQTPKMGDLISYIDPQGLGVQTTDVYKNQFTEGDKLYGERLMLKAEVRIGCDLKSFVDSYQIQYVERTELNRTIIAQGLAGPLQRWNKYYDINLYGESVTPDVHRKWTLPYKGGPLHERYGFETYDTYGEDFEETESEAEEVMKRRIITNRRLMYFDSPDLIYGTVSSALVGNAKATVISRLKTDHNRGLLNDMQVDERDTDPFNRNGTVTFSKKLYEGGKVPEEDLANIFKSENKKYNPYWMDCSVFSASDPYNAEHNIEKFGDANNGIILPAVMLDMKHQISNNALTIGEPSWAYSSQLRDGQIAKGNIGDWELSSQAVCQFLNCSNKSTGYRTLFLKTETDLFTNDFLGPEIINVSCPYFRGDKWSQKPTTDSHALINLKLDNEATVYGGRTKYDLSKNVYMPVGKVIPVHAGTNQSQISIEEGDTYVTLFVRTKNDWHKHNEFKLVKNMQNHTDRGDDSRDENEYNRPNAWMYAVVVETQVEERMTHEERHYRDSAPFDFSKELKENINPAYFVENNLKTFYPKPFNFKEDPLLSDIIAASKVKFAGDYYDAFTVFLVNDFYALGRHNGDITNIVAELDQLFVIQETVTNQVVMDPKDTIQTKEGADIQVATGTGTVFHNHKVVSRYGTSIRGAVVKGEFGFSFYDERKNEYVRGVTPLATKHSLALRLKEMYATDPVVNTQGWYDDKYKESNIMLVSKSGVKRVISYSEVIQAFNPFYNYNADQYFRFDEKVFAPRLDAENNLHQLNEGNMLELFGDQQTMKVGIVVHGMKSVSNIYKALSISVNMDYAVDWIKINDNLSQSSIRTILGSHFKYDIKDGIHTVPLRNKTDRAPKRGEWAYIEIQLSALNNNQIDLFKITTHLRKSIL